MDRFATPSAGFTASLAPNAPAFPSTGGFPSAAGARCCGGSPGTDPMASQLMGQQAMTQLMSTMMMLLTSLMMGRALQDMVKALSPRKGGGSRKPSKGQAGRASAAASAAQPTGKDGDTAKSIDRYLQSKGSPAAGKGTGALMVKYGKQYNVNPLALLAIAGQETQYGKLGVGVNGMLGVGAYDSNPNNSTRNPKFSGIENQIRVGAQTFAKLRAKGGASAGDSMERQLAAVNRAGWATDTRWHSGVGSIYAQLMRMFR